MDWMERIAQRQGTGKEKVRIGRLYGVLYNLTVDVRSGSVDLRLRPSTAMLDELSKMKRGTLVGMELLEPAHRGAIVEEANKYDMELEKNRVGYLEDLEEHCKASGIGIAYLESPEIVMEHLNAEVRLRTMRDELYGMRVYDQIAERLKSVERSEHALLVEREYLQNVSQVSNMISEMKRQGPEAALITKEHAQILWGMQLSGRLEIEFKSAAAEMRPKMDYRLFYAAASAASEMYEKLSSTYEGSQKIDIAELLGSDIPPNRFDEGMMGSLKALARADSCMRSHSAVKNGKITEGRPDFIGTDDVDVPLRGLFELYIKEESGNEVSGTIEDVYGMAAFRGTFDDAGFRFIKHYGRKAVMAGGDLYDIRFEGRSDERLPGSVSGEFRMLDGSRGAFRMVAFR